MPSVTDNFNRANENPLTVSTWTTTSGVGSLQVVSNACECVTTSTPSKEWYSGVSWVGFADQYAECQIVALDTAGDQGPCVRMASAANTMYMLDAIHTGIGSTNLQILKCVGGGVSVLDTSSATLSLNDTIRITISGGATTTMQATINGGTPVTWVTSGTDTVTDSSSPILTGAPGLWLNAVTSLASSIVDAFAAASTGGGGGGGTGGGTGFGTQNVSIARRVEMVGY